MYIYIHSTGDTLTSEKDVENNQNLQVDVPEYVPENGCGNCYGG